MSSMFLIKYKQGRYAHIYRGSDKQRTSFEETKSLTRCIKAFYLCADTIKFRTVEYKTHNTYPDNPGLLNT